jgi:phenylalanyl-tRNA synthetase beta chain
MLISLNWIKKYVKIDIPNDELVKLIGARLVEVEEAIDETHKYDGIFAVKVVSAEKIPDTHLTLCMIDDGGKAKDVVRNEDNYVQVMCGAPNVHEGMMAAWIAPGAIVPATFHDDEPFEIGMRKMLKKYDSYGMLAGADELALGDDHSGIVELDPASAKPGDDFAKLFDLDDIILDIENKSLTHRPDTFGILGFAREVAGILGQQFHTEDWHLRSSVDFEVDKSVKLDIEIDEKLCPRYTAVVLSSKNNDSPKYLTLQDTLLARSGMRPIEPIVDLTNILMLLSGQPLHAFDYDKFVSVGKSDKPKIIVRAAKKGEKLTLLDDKEIEMNEDDIVITSNTIPVALAGAMGGANTAIDEKPERIILESATFSLYNLRKTQMAHGIFSEAITRFTKGQPAGQTLPVALRFAELAQNIGYQPLAVFDSQKATPKAEKVELELLQLNNLLGTDFTIKQACSILQNVEFSVESKGKKLIATVPFWRTDIHIPEDLIE